MKSLYKAILHAYKLSYQRGQLNFLNLSANVSNRIKYSKVFLKVILTKYSKIIEF